jgi:hypothetical protein
LVFEIGAKERGKKGKMKMGSFLYPDRFSFFPYIVAEMGYPSSRVSLVKEHTSVTPRMMMMMSMVLPSSL